MRKLLIGSIALLTAGVLAVAGVALLGPDGAVAQETDETDTITEHRFIPLDEALDELVKENVIDTEQADAIRQRMSEKMAGGFHFEGDHGPMGFGFMGDGFRMDGFMDELPEGVTAPPGPPGTPEFEAWLDEMTELMGDDFFGGHMFRFDDDRPGDGTFRHGPGSMGPGMMGEGFRQFPGFGDFNSDDLQGFIDEMTDRLDGEIPEHMQDMIDHLREQMSDITGAETSFDA